jgi:hypothetical protein
LAVNDDQDARIWQGLRAHLDDLGELAPAPDLPTVRDRSVRGNRGRALVPLAGTAVVLVVAVLILSRGGLFGTSSPGAGAATTSAVIKIEGGLTPRMTVDEVEAAVLRQIHAMEEIAGTVVRPPAILSVTATTAAGVATLEPGSGQQEPPALGIQWLVRAEGTFTNNRTPPGGSPMIAATGFFIIDDATGLTIGFGFP